MYKLCLMIMSMSKVTLLFWDYIIHMVGKESIASFNKWGNRYDFGSIVSNVKFILEYNEEGKVSELSNGLYFYCIYIKIFQKNGFPVSGTRLFSRATNKIRTYGSLITKSAPKWLIYVIYQIILMVIT